MTTTLASASSAQVWEHLIRDDNDYARHVDYVHCNPMKHGLVNKVADRPYSSFHRYVSDGLYPVDWAGNVELLNTVNDY